MPSRFLELLDPWLTVAARSPSRTHVAPLATLHRILRRGRAT